MNDKTVAYSVVIPVFNETHNIEELYKRLKKVMEGLGALYEIIIVDDGSTDSSFEMLKKKALSDKTLRILRFDRNYGQHKAMTSGILEALGSYIITIDADLQNPPEEIVRLLEKSREGFDMVAGYRRIRKDSFSRRLGSFVTNLIISMINGLRMRDYGTMIRVFKRETARALALEYLKSEGYISMFIAKITHNVAEVEVRHDERYGGKSKYGIRKLFPLFCKILFYYNDGLRGLVRKKPQGPLFIIESKIENGQETIISNTAR